MKNHGLLASVLVALAIALGFGFATVAQAGTNGSGSSSSECLGLATDAIQDWKFLYPCCHDQETCEEACENWTRTCNDIARIAHQCQYTSGREFTDLFKGSECDTDEDKSDSKACAQEASNGLQQLRSFLDSNYREAKETCFDCFDDCVNFCEND
ncbi:MAG: hypothetical protein Q8R92_00115 [Deltaproteobacteria bacterium]|nr:hypothetical protein [Deltaproteobacteria bacterium]